MCHNVVVFKCRKICPTEIGKIVRYLPDQKTNKISAASQTVATAQIAPKIFQVQPPTYGPHCSRFHPNRFNFGGVIAERVKILLPPTVEPIIRASARDWQSRDTLCQLIVFFVDYSLLLVDNDSL